MQSLKEQNGAIIESISKQLQDLTANLKKQIGYELNAYLLSDMKSEKNALQAANTQLKNQVEELTRRFEERPVIFHIFFLLNLVGILQEKSWKQ